MNAAEKKYQRSNEILKVLQTGMYTKNQLAKKFDIGATTIFDDIKAMREMGLPVRVAKIEKTGPGRRGRSRYYTYGTEPDFVEHDDDKAIVVKGSAANHEHFKPNDFDKWVFEARKSA